MDQTLRALFQTLQANNIKYFLLTDFEGDLASKDIDLFVHHTCRKPFEDTLLLLGWYKRKEPSHHTNHFFYFSIQTDTYLDVKYELSFAQGANDCYTYLSTEQALHQAVQNPAEVYRPGGLDALLLYAAHLGYRERGTLEARHGHYLKLYLGLYAKELPLDACPVAEALSDWLQRGFPHDQARLQQILQPYFSHSHRKMVRAKKFSRYGYGLKVLFLGTDGAGKTTLLEAVEQKLNLKTSKLYLGMGENGWSRPWVKSMYNYRFKLRLADLLYSALKTYVVLPAELLLRQLPVKLRSRYSIVLIDRVPGANLIEKKAGKGLLYRSVIPKPDLVFFLHASPEELRKRKPLENTLERSKADLIKFREVAHAVSSGNYISIDTTNLTINEARDLIIAEILRNEKVYDKLLTAKF